ncbi:heme-thiolate peroxidase [Auricularia subglabra TFB-10046 SS5]|nr:heme-thiolate peroxidase [Auricularia subglabra TFB-10046 SS5]
MQLTRGLSTLLVITCALAATIKPYQSLAGLSHAEIEAFVRSVNVPIVGAEPVPPPIEDTSSKLVNDAEHPYMPLKDGDQRGPCPGLNALASHGYLPRSGVATPAQIINAVQEGFNMAHDIAIFVTYAAFLVNGNQLTNLMSIGSSCGLSSLTGPAPPLPALAGGLNVHGTFEGDASLSRSDDFLGDNHNFNATLFDQIISDSKTYGGGRYNMTAAGEVRWRRIQESIAHNPDFYFSNPRFNTAYAEAVFPIAYFIDGRVQGDDVRGATGLDLEVMRGFFADHRMPQDFHRRAGAFGLSDVGRASRVLLGMHPIQPGFNNGSTNAYVEDPDFFGEDEGNTSCALYRKFVNTTVALYPSPQGKLRKALNVNLENFYTTASKDADCLPSQPYPDVSSST